MLLYFHKDPGGNFGDDLNPWLWNRLFPGLFSGELYHDPRQRTPFADDEPLFVGIGTLLNSRIPARNPKIVFGSGVGYGDAPPLDATWRIRFVRGPLTAEVLKLPASMAIADPALLAADRFTPDVPRVRDIAYMPHCASIRSGEWDAVCAEAGVRLIDPRWPVERVLQSIANTSVLLTEALHGAILADAFRVPWVPVRTQPAVLEFKWQDWCRSIGVNYAPVALCSLWKPQGGTFNRAKYVVKKRLAQHQLQRLVRSHRPLLSHTSTLADIKDRLAEQVHGFARDHVAELGG
jgi:succinoglycan biosynthesis protein ExoV